MTISSLAGSSFNNIPVVNNEELHQTVRVKLNQSAELAQFIAPQTSTNLNGTPFLGEVAHGGLDLAAQTAEQNQNTELLILVTPRIVALNRRKDHVIYAGRGSLEGAGSFGFTQQERRGGLQLPCPNSRRSHSPDLRNNNSRRYRSRRLNPRRRRFRALCRNRPIPLRPIRPSPIRRADRRAATAVRMQITGARSRGAAGANLTIIPVRTSAQRSAHLWTPASRNAK